MVKPTLPHMLMPFQYSSQGTSALRLDQGKNEHKSLSYSDFLVYTFSSISETFMLTHFFLL